MKKTIFGILLLSCTALAMASGGSFITSGVVASLRGSLLGSAAPPPFTPGSLSGLTLWLDADNPTSITQSGGKVSQWVDQSPTGATFTQATAGLQPAYVASGIGGKPSLSFSGSSTGSGILVDTGTNQFVGDGTAPFSIWTVVQPGTAAAFIVFAEFHATGGGNDPEFGYAQGSGYEYIWIGGNVGQPFGQARSSVADFQPPNDPYMITVTYDGAGNYVFYKSNAVKATSSVGSAGGITPNTRIGGVTAAGLDPVELLSEMVVVDHVFSSGERTNLQTYGEDKYGAL